MNKKEKQDLEKVGEQLISIYMNLEMYVPGIETKYHKYWRILKKIDEVIGEINEAMKQGDEG